MRRAAAIAGLALLTLANQGTGTAAAQANPLTGLPTAKLDGTNGYELTVWATDDSIVLIAERDSYRVSYVSRDSRSTRRRLVGTFGSAGSIRMEFVVRGPAREHRLPGCEGTYTTRRGAWTGSLSFLGSGAYTSAAASEVPGRTVTRVDLDCDSEGSEEEEEAEPQRARHGHFLSAATRRSAPSVVALDVFWLKGQRRAQVTATVEVEDGPVTITYEAERRAPRERVHLSIRRGRARVEPGPPFAGIGKFRASDEDVDISNGIPSEPGPTWEGNLAVSMPGLGLVPLTGPEFKAIAGGLTVITL